MCVFIEFCVVFVNIYIKKEITHTHNWIQKSNATTGSPFLLHPHLSLFLESKTIHIVYHIYYTDKTILTQLFQKKTLTVFVISFHLFCYYFKFLVTFLDNKQKLNHNQKPKKKNKKQQQPHFKKKPL